jgi:hypothetical protein
VELPRFDGQFIVFAVSSRMLAEKAGQYSMRVHGSTFEAAGAPFPTLGLGRGQFAPNLDLLSGSPDLLDEKPLLRKGSSILSGKHFVWKAFKRVLRYGTVLFCAEN